MGKDNRKLSKAEEKRKTLYEENEKGTSSTGV